MPQAKHKKTHAWAGTWEAWGKAYRCKVYASAAGFHAPHAREVAEVRIVGKGSDELSGDAPVAEGLAVADVFCEVVSEAVRIIRNVHQVPSTWRDGSSQEWFGVPLHD